MVAWEWSGWSVPELFEELLVYLEDDDEGEGVRDWSACSTVGPILQTQLVTFFSARSSRRGRWLAFQGDRLGSEERGEREEESGSVVLVERRLLVYPCRGGAWTGRLFFSGGTSKVLIRSWFRRLGGAD
jgi:hypothetical protein